jgi:hypothetical protein
MKRCPKCLRFGVEYDPYTGTERCLWNDCQWVNTEFINLDNQHNRINFRRFRKSIRIKKAVAA